MVARGPVRQRTAPMSSGGSETQPNLQIMSQYIKDLSFENPGAPAGFTSNPDLEMVVDLKVRTIAADLYEVVLSMRINATGDGKPLFILELAYAALVRLTNMPEEM